MPVALVAVTMNKYVPLLKPLTVIGLLAPDAVVTRVLPFFTLMV
jgi:hypothetical protein